MRRSKFITLLGAAGIVIRQCQYPRKRSLHIAVTTVLNLSLLFMRATGVHIYNSMEKPSRFQDV